MENENPLISVIVPVYKTQDYLRKCVDSILAQTFSNFEVILVDDASPDDSGLICDEYAKLDQRVRVIHHKLNRKLPDTRVSGILESRGTWVSFVESDDFLPKRAFEVLARFATDDTDLVEGSFKDFLLKHTPRDKNIEDAQIVDVVDARGFVDGILKGLWSLSTWGKLYRRTLIANENVFKISKDFNIGEDGILNFRFAANGLRKSVKIDAIVYFYLVNRPGSATKTQVAESYLFRFFDELKEFFEKVCPKEDEDIFREYVRKFIPEIVKSSSSITCDEWAKRIKPTKKTVYFKKLNRYYWMMKTRLVFLWRFFWELGRRTEKNRIQR